MQMICLLCNIVGKVENGRGLFAAGDQTIEFLQFKGDLFCSPIFLELWVF